MKTLEEVLLKANASYDEDMKLRPDIHSEDGRIPFVLGYLKRAYEVLYNEYKLKNNK